MSKGNQISLPCNYSQVVHTIDWRKEDDSIGVPIVMLNVTDGNFERSGLGYNEGRFNISRDYSLILKDVSFQDEGRYICKVLDAETGLYRSNHTDLSIRGTHIIVLNTP